MLVSGKPGAGKSALLREFILNPELYYQKFDAYVIFSPKEIEGLECQKDGPFQNFFHEFNLDKVFAYINKCNTSQKARKKEIEAAGGKFTARYWFNLVILIDDCIGTVKKLENDPRLK